MLTEIKKGTNVSTEEVVAVNTSNDVLVGYLTQLPDGEWICESEETMLEDVTHYITVKNLLKTK
jgi:hypothetical protein